MAETHERIETQESNSLLDIKEKDQTSIYLEKTQDKELFKKFLNFLLLILHFSPPETIDYIVVKEKKYLYFKILPFPTVSVFLQHFYLKKSFLSRN